jgi:hypothetical protein
LAICVVMLTAQPVFRQRSARVAVMTDKSIDLDKRRGMTAQRETELRRLLAEVMADQSALRQRQDEVESHLLAQPAEDWVQAADKARYVLGLYAASLARGDVRIAHLIAAVLEDFDRLSASSG